MRPGHAPVAWGASWLMGCPGCGVDRRDDWWCNPCLTQKVRDAAGMEFPVPRPQPEKKKFITHLAKDINHERVITACGAQGKAYGWDKKGLRTTAWGGEVTCPACNRVPSQLARRTIDSADTPGTTHAEA